MHFETLATARNCKITTKADIDDVRNTIEVSEIPPNLSSDSKSLDNCTYKVASPYEMHPICRDHYV